MRSLIKAETRKLLTTRTAYGVLVAMLFLSGPGILLAGETSVAELSKPLQEQIWFFVAAGFTRLLVVVLGIRSVTDEFRHGTIVPSVLATPARHRLMTAKAITVGTAGLVFTVLAEVVMVGFAAVFIPSKGAELTVASETVGALLGMAAAGMLWGIIGVAIGALVRHQIPAIVGSLLWLLPGGGIEELIRGRLGALGDYLPGNGGLALALGDSATAWLAGGILALYALVLMVAGSTVMRSRDITT
jgi:ABC-type transport system involved in multi-copper enzyme maturation permease subunit